MPYVYRPVRGQVLSVVNKEFVEAAIAQGASNFRLIFSEILPNVVSTVIVLLPLMVATNMLTESALSFLSVGVQPPNVSWGRSSTTARTCCTPGRGCRWRPAS